MTTDRARGDDAFGPRHGLEVGSSAKRVGARLALAGVALVLALSGTAMAQTDAPAAPMAAPAMPAAPATPAPATPAPATPAPGASGSLSGIAAWEKLKGNTISGKSGGDTFAEFFDPAGNVKYVDKDGLSSGTWAVQNTKVCFDFPDDDDRGCSAFTVTGSSGTSVDDDGVTEHFEIQPGNAKGL